MSDYSPPARQGYTKTGKSLRAVRRYYAMKDAARKRKSPPDRDDRAPQASVSKRKRSPDDDKLSKRIAAELRVQQEANERRQYPVNQPTDRSSNLPIIIQPNETGPIFMTDTNIPKPKSVKSTKSIKSVKSFKSGTGTIVAPIADSPQSQYCSSTSIGVSISLLVVAIVYISTWILMMVSKVQGEKTRVSIRWLALSSIIVVVIIPYWLLERHQFRHSLFSLIGIIASGINLIVHLVYHLVVRLPPLRSGETGSISGISNPLNFIFSTMYLVIHVLVISYMIKHLLALVTKQVEAKYLTKAPEPSPSSPQSQGPQMSEYLAP